MITFTINDENNIMVFGNATEASQDSTAVPFDSEAALARISSAWPLSRFVEIWNGIPGHAEVSRFADRNKAVARIWKALQPLAARGDDVRPDAATANTKVAREKNRRRSQQKPANKKAGRKRKRAQKRGAAASNKKAAVLGMLKRAQGATLGEIMEVTGWQKHTVRGFISILGSKGGEKIVSSKNAAGERMYQITE